MKTQRNLSRQPHQAILGRAWMDRRGVALITSLILLSVALLLGMAVVMTTSGDVFISGAMRNSKTAYYAADAGVSVMRKLLTSALKTATPVSLTDGTQPVFPCTSNPTAANCLTLTNSILTSALTTAGNGSAQTFSSFSTNGDIPTTYTVDTSNDSNGNPRTWFKFVSLQAPTGPPFAANASRNELYTFGYQITSKGNVTSPVGSLASSSVVETGTITYNIDVDFVDQSSQYQNMMFSFAGYGMFIDQANPHTDGLTLAHGTVTGRVHTNGEWGFTPGTNPAYLFTDLVSNVSPNAYWYFYGVNNSPSFDANSSSYTYSYTTGSGRNKTTISTSIAPTFMAGYNRGVASVPIPANSNNQAAAVLDGAGFDPNNPLATEPMPTQSQMAAKLLGLYGNMYSGGTGVYLPVDPLTHTQISGGGIYVQGTVSDMTVTASTTTGSDGLLKRQQIYTILQGTTSRQVIIHMDNNDPACPGSGPCTYLTDPTITTFVPGSTLYCIGVPTALYPVNPNRDPSIQPLTSVSLYVNGSISSLHGPGDGLPAVQDRAAMTITASSNITITDDILYVTAPVTRAQGQVAPGVPANSPMGTLIPGNDNGQALGIYSPNGNIILSVDNIESRNIEVDASLAAMRSNGTNGITIGNTIPYNITVVGGRIQSQAMALGQVGVTVRNILFDRRYANSAYAPPFFPCTSAAIVRGQIHDYQYTVVAPDSSLKAIPSSYMVPSRMVAAANAGQ
jgi:Tfp pilus assembly protein PilX